MADYDAVFVGSGINSLVGAAMLAKAGWSVCVLERNDWLGGTIRSAEITQPGFAHDLLAAWHPLFVGSPAFAELGEDLKRRGLEYLNTDCPTATLFPDGGAVFLSTSQEANVEEFERQDEADGRAWRRAMADFMATSDVAFGMLGTDLWSRQGLSLMAKAWRAFGKRGRWEFGAGLLGSCRDWLAETFQSPGVHGLLAPWVLHTGLGPDEAGSGFMTQVIAAALQLGGMPVPRGGGSRLAQALARLIEDSGGRCKTGCHVSRVAVRAGRARGVLAQDGTEFAARRAVICSVAPSQLYLGLLSAQEVPAQVRAAAARFRHGRADMQIHLALSQPPCWPGGDERFSRTAIIHVTPGLDGVSRAVNEADRGLLPAEATIVVGQPTAVDPSRAPSGKWILWIQLQELPARPRGDAAGLLDCGDGAWSDALKEAYADRIIRRLGTQIPNLESSILKRVVLSPADLERLNINLVGGDPYGGTCSLDQLFLFRPLPGLPGHKTPIAGLYHIGASTHPGPGLHGTSGYLVAKSLLKMKRGWR